jgi:hypothetical protein
MRAPVGYVRTVHLRLLEISSHFSQLEVQDDQDTNLPIFCNMKSCSACFLLSIVLVLGLSLCQGFQFSNRNLSKGGLESVTEDGGVVDRKKFLLECGLSFMVLTAVPSKSHAKSYSANARNMDRMNTGDMSGGSTYDNDPKSEPGRKRRGITGCKIPVAREEAAESVLKISALSEKECNQMVLGGESEFMLQALRTLDCPTCPYGISSSRK